MPKNAMKNDYFKYIIKTYLLFTLVPLQAQVNDTTMSQMYFDLSNSIRIDASLLIGVGFKEFDVFKTNNNEMVSLSPGGGIGFTLGAGYYFNELFLATVDLGIEESLLSQELKNADGSFYRSFISSTLRYKFPISEFSSINGGAGAGWYMSGEMDIDAHKIDEGAHNIYYFKDTAGFHILAEYEEQLPNFTFMNARWSWLGGLKYYYIKYKLESAKSDGVKIPIDSLPVRLQKDFKDLNGSGIDIYFSLVMHI